MSKIQVTIKYYQVSDLIFKSRSRGNSPTVDPPLINLPICASDVNDDFGTDTAGKTCPSGYV